MRVFQRLFIYAYLLNKRLDAGNPSPEWIAITCLSILVSMNVVTLINIAAICTGDRSIIPFGGNGLWILGTAFEILWFFLFLRNKRFKGLLIRYEAFPRPTKEAIGRMGTLHLLLTFVLFLSPYVLLARTG